MSSDQFGVQMQELNNIEADWRSVSSRLEELSRRIGRIHATLARATAVDLASSTVAGLPGFAVAYQVLDDVRQIEAATKRLQADKDRLTQEMAQDADKIKAVREEYEATEKKIAEGMKKPPKHTPPTPSPKKPTGGTHHQGDGGHHGNGTPDGTRTDAARIPVSQVTYGGAGSWKGGKEACEDYINQAMDKLGITDPQARARWMQGMLTIASRESAYNSPHYQVNKGDVNAVGAPMSDGAPARSSRGGWQCIPGTFAEYHQPGTSTDIYDPVANCAASMNYIMSRYHVSRDGSNLASQVQQADPNRKPRGY
ncbi:hypothetical protein [Peterkaempfera griseoplana]|uniref:hypothetical protein n=1 Tax=Peterkaempfera griseoplana TaxID=66896 RepID=UPI0006E23D65|nr:hypothetical protein [Peterkaempfera griseoplana]